MSQNGLILTVNLTNSGRYDATVFYSDCSFSVTHGVTYIVVPKKIEVGGLSIPINWSGNAIDVDDNYKAVYTMGGGNSCRPVGPAGNHPGAVINTYGSGDLSELPPGEYTYSMTYYVGGALTQSDAESLDFIRSYALQGAASSTPVETFTGVAACAQDSPTAGATIDFGTVTSNGTVQPGPLTTMGLACNYDVALNDVTYSLTSNNPVSGEPSTGQSVAVKLSNGATVRLDGGNVTQPDPKKVSVNITPSIDTQGAIAGEGTGSATLTFNYE